MSGQPRGIQQPHECGEGVATQTRRANTCGRTNLTGHLLVGSVSRRPDAFARLVRRAESGTCSTQPAGETMRTRIGRLRKWLLIVNGVLWPFLILVLVVAPDDENAEPPTEVPTVMSPEPSDSTWVLPSGNRGPKASEWAKPGDPADREASAKSPPPPTAKPEPVPEPEPVEVPAGWEPVDYKPDGLDTVATEGKLLHMVYIYPTAEASTEQMIATAMQVAWETYRAHGSDEISVGVMEGPGEDYPLEIVGFYPTNGCSREDECSGGVWTSSLVIPPAVLAALDVPSREEAAAASQKRVAAEKAREGARVRAQKARSEKVEEQYELCFNGWNGSHKVMVDLVKENIDAPRSFKHVKTTAYLGDFPRPVLMQFDAQNAFGAMIRTTVKAMSDLDCSVIITDVVGP